jgi:putative inorganic carbon (hco3(-)) transporter
MRDICGWRPARWLAHAEPRQAALLTLGLAYYYLMSSPVLALPGLLLYIVVAWRRPALALCLLPLTFAFWYVPKRVVGHLVFPLSEIALAVCFGVIVARWLIAVGPRGLVPRLRRAAVILFGRIGAVLCLGAALLALGTAIGVVLARRHPEALRAFRWEIAEPLLYLALVVLTTRGARLTRWLVGAFLVSAALMAALALFQVAVLHVTFSALAAGNRLVPYLTASGGAPRATGIFYGSGNSLGALLERALPVALALIVVCGAVSPAARLASGGCLVLCFFALLLSDSRGAEVGAALGCLLVLLVALRRWWVAALVVGGLALAALWQRDRLARELLAGHGGTGEVRTLVWRAAWRMALDHPLFGIGPDQFLYYYSSRYTNHPYWIPFEHGHPTPALYQPDLSHPHNLPLELWLSGGLLAVGGFAVVLYDVTRRCIRLWRAGGGAGWPAAVALGVGASLAAGLAHGMVDSAYFAPDLALDFWWAVALLVVLSRQFGARRPKDTTTAR